MSNTLTETAMSSQPAEIQADQLAAAAMSGVESDVDAVVDSMVPSDGVDATQDQPVELSILSIVGHSYPVMATLTWSVRGLKDVLSNITGTNLPWHQQRLLLGSRILSDAEILGEVLPSHQTSHELLLVMCDDAVKTDLITSLVSGRGGLRSAERKYREDPDVVLAAVRSDGMQLEYALGPASTDRNVVLAAIQKNGFALSFAPHGFQADWDVALMAVKSSAFSFTLAAESLRSDCDFAIAAVRENVFARDYLDRSILDRPEFIKIFGRTPLRPGEKKKKETEDSNQSTRIANVSCTSNEYMHKNLSKKGPLLPDTKEARPDSNPRRSFCLFCGCCPSGVCRLAWCRMASKREAGDKCALKSDVSTTRGIG